MKFRISPDVVSKFPHVCIGVVVAMGVNNKGEQNQIKALLKDNIHQLHNRFKNSKQYRNHPNILPWREAFSECGINPNKFPSSIEALVKRISKKPKFPSINPVVNLVNAMALKYILPMGAHDLDKLQGDFEVRLSKDGDVFTPFGKSNFEKVDEGEIVYADGQEVRTRRWVWRQGEKAKITGDSTNVFVPIDGFYNSTYGDVIKARDELEELFYSFFDCSVKKFLVDKNTPEIEL